jgi:hypothetical protein
MTGFELATLLVIGTDCTGRCKSNYHTITTTTALNNKKKLMFGQINLSSAEDWVTTWFRLLSSDNKLNTSCVFFSLIWSNKPFISRGLGGQVA